MVTFCSHLNALAAGFWRRLAAIVYDAVLLSGLLFIAAALAVLANRGEAIRGAWFSAYLLLVSFLFYGWFWTHGGQTLGMRAWKIQVLQRQGGSVTWPQALGRFLLAVVSWSLFGLGFFWILVDREKLAWHDRLSNTMLIYSKNLNRKL